MSWWGWEGDQDQQRIEQGRPASGQDPKYDSGFLGGITGWLGFASQEAAPQPAPNVSSSSQGLDRVEGDQQQQRASSEVRKDYCGVGITFSKSPKGALAVHSFVAGGSAEQVGLLYPGDELIQVDGINVHGRPLPFISGLLLGPEGTIVELTVFRPSNSELVTLSIPRSKGGSPAGPESRPGSQPQGDVMTALHTAVMMSAGGAEAATNQVRQLLGDGHDVNQKDPDGCTPIFYAAANPQVLQMLLDKGAQVNVQNRLGNTPLHYAAAGDGDVVCELLVQNQADVTLKNTMGLTAWDLARTIMKKKSFAYLDTLHHHTESRAVRKADESLNVQLLQAVSREGPGTTGQQLHEILRMGADPNALDHKLGLRALHLAVFRDSPAAVRVLLEAGAVPSLWTTNDDALSALACATILRKHEPGVSEDKRKQPSAVVLELLRGDTDPSGEVFVKGGCTTPLHMAVMNGDAVLVETLLKGGADPEIEDRYGLKPLDVAEKGVYFHLKPQEDIARLIKSVTASAEHKAALAQWRNQFRPVKQYPAGLPSDKDDALCQAAVFGDCHRITELCNAGANPDSQQPSRTDFKGPDTCLARVAARGSGRATSLLVQSHGAKASLQGPTSGQGPIHFAAKFGHANVLKLLLRSGVEKDCAVLEGTTATNEHRGYTPLMLAVKYNQPFTALVLLQAGAKTDLQAADGKTAMGLTHSETEQAKFIMDIMMQSANTM